MQSERVGDDLRGNRRMALAIRGAAQAQRDLSAWIDRDHCAGISARFAVGTAAVLRRLRQRNIGHIRAGWFYTRCQADAEKPSLAADFVAPAFELVIVGDPQELRQRCIVVAGVEYGACRRSVRESIDRNEIATAQFRRIHGEPARRDVHDTFEGKIELWSPVSSIETHGCAVRDNELVVDGNVLHLVAAV